MKNVLIVIISLAILAVSCVDPVLDFNGNSKSTNGNVVIRLAGSDGRTILPITPQFNRYNLSIVNKEDDSIIETPDASDIKGAGVTVTLSAGTWEIALKGYCLIDGKEVLAAQGTNTLTVENDKSKYNVAIKMEPIAISNSNDNGLFSFNITLPDAELETATLNISDDNNINENFNLKDSNTGSIPLAAGYYHLTIKLTNSIGQSSGIFESVHIYSGLESPANINLSHIKFSETVYLAGTLGGIRIGKIVIVDDDEEIIRSIELNDNSAKRSDTWITEIPSKYIAKNIRIIQKFESDTVTFENFDAHSQPKIGLNGKDDINLTLKPTSAKYINLVDWYSEKNNGDIYFGFDVTANFIVVNKSGSIENIILPGVVTKDEFKAGDYAGSSITGIYYAADRSGLITAIDAAQAECDAVNVSVNGKEYKSTVKWVTSAEKAAYQSAINYAINAKNNPELTDEQIAAAKAALDVATSAFENAKKSGTYKVDKSPLESAIINANAKMTGVTESVDGSDVLNTDKWATPQAFNALNAAIADAQAYIDATDNTDDDQDVVNTRVTTLNDAAAAFTTQNGLLIRTGIVFEYTVNMPKDENIVIPEVAAMSWVAGDTFTLTAEGFDTYQWYVDGVLKATGNTFELKARDYSVATHNLTLRITKDDVPYTKTVTFKVN